MNPERGELREQCEGKTYPYDAMVFLSGGVMKHGERYHPSDYRTSDDFGMLGGGMRMVAAVESYIEGKTKRIVFPTGVTEKMRAKYGPDVPSDAATYRDKFDRDVGLLRKRPDLEDQFSHLEEPEVLIEERSVNTLGNIREIFQMIQDNGWQKVAIVSSGYHIPRSEALFRQALAQHPELGVEVDFLSAEEIAKTARPGVYDDVIERAHRTPEAKKRIANEQRGLEDLTAGRYAVGEFQLDDRSKTPPPLEEKSKEPPTLPNTDPKTGA